MERETNKSPKVIDTCACYIKIKYQYFDILLTIDHISREISISAFVYQRR